jgi:type I site-specific restriction-modification system R (restriction) subunit
MSNNNQNQWDDDDDFDLEDEPQIQPQGNDLVKQLRKADRLKEKRIKEMEQELQTLRSQQREVSVSKVLESEGFNPKISKFIPADVQEPEAIKAWLNENAEILGYQPKTEVQQVQMPNDWESLQAMDDVVDGALSPNQIDNQYELLNQAQNRDDLMRLIMGQD